MPAALLAVGAGIPLLWLGTVAGLLVAWVAAGDMRLALYLAVVIILRLRRSQPPVRSPPGWCTAGGRRRNSSAPPWVSLLPRAVADTSHGLGWLRWASPLGWVDELRPFAGLCPAVLLLFTAAAAVLLAAAARLVITQDVGDAAFWPRDTARPPPRLLGSPASLALPFERASLAGWALGAGAYALIIGGLAKPPPG